MGKLMHIPLCTKRHQCDTGALCSRQRTKRGKGPEGNAAPHALAASRGPAREPLQARGAAGCAARAVKMLVTQKVAWQSLGSQDVKLVIPPHLTANRFAFRPHRLTAFFLHSATLDLL